MTEFNQQKAIEHYAELSRRISIGAYNERQHDGSYGVDGVEQSLDNLTYQAAQYGLTFSWHEESGTWQLSPLPDEAKAAFLHVNVENLVSILAEASRYLNTFPYESGLEKSSRLGLLERIKETIEQSYRVPVLLEESQVQS